ncbi:MAG: DUF2493 domain-containing protein [Treponema sp.]|jgi:hypothetical protein|nr:DUF2493 domain-containing protein [Treponema sp.]
MKKLYVIIAGSRVFNNYEVLREALNEVSEEYDDVNVMSGGAGGAGSLGEIWANEYNYNIRLFPANWNLYGNYAGAIRNKEMLDFLVHRTRVEQCDGKVLCFWNGTSPGTFNMIKLSKEMGIEPLIYKMDPVTTFKDFGIRGLNYYPAESRSLGKL